MKKILIPVLLVAFLGLSFSFVSADDEKINECCRIKNAFTIGSDSYTADTVYGSLEATADNCSFGAPDTANKTSEWGMVCLMDTIYTVTNWAFYLTTLFAILMIVWGGFTYITAAGDPAKTGKGKTIITYALIGLAVALLAKVLPSLVRFILGM